MISVRKVYGSLVEKLSPDLVFLTISLASLFVLFRMGLNGNVVLSDSPFLIVDEGYAGAAGAHIHFNISYPKLSCDFMHVEITDGNETSKLNVTKYFNKYSIDPNSNSTGSISLSKPVTNVAKNDQIVGKADGKASVVLNIENFIRIAEQHAILVVLLDKPPWFWRTDLKPSWEQAARIIRERYDPETDGRILMGHVDCAQERFLCLLIGPWFRPGVSIFRRASDIIVEYNAKKKESYEGDRDTKSLVKAMEDLMAPIPLQWQRGCRIEGTLRLKTMPGNLYLSASSGIYGKRVTTKVKPMFIKFLRFYSLTDTFEGSL